MNKSAAINQSQLEQLQDAFKREFHAVPTVLAAAPGRVNLIGEHTDYNDGFVMPMALDREIYVAARPRPDRKVHLYSVELEKSASFDLEQLYRNGAQWNSYVAAVYWAAQQKGLETTGAEIAIYGTLPQGCGLSSSAALELAIARALAGLASWSWEPSKMALMCQEAENDFIGVKCGIMDQFAVAVCEPQSALFLDCRSLETRSIPVAFEDAEFLVVNSMVKRQLQSSHYNERREECQDAVRELRKAQANLESLRDVTLQTLEATPGHESLWGRRARHVISENRRVQAAVDALVLKDLQAFGSLMNDSHESLRKDYEVSCAELDLLVDTARACEGVYGARLTGAGFGGCTVNLVHSEAVPEIQKVLKKKYKAVTGMEPQIFSFRPGAAARLL